MIQIALGEGEDFEGFPRKKKLQSDGTKISYLGLKDVTIISNFVIGIHPPAVDVAPNAKLIALYLTMDTGT